MLWWFFAYIIASYILCFPIAITIAKQKEEYQTDPPAVIATIFWVLSPIFGWYIIAVLPFYLISCMFEFIANIGKKK